MNIISTIDPSQFLTGGNIITGGVNKNEQLMLYNDSPYGLKLTFADNSTDILPAYWNKDFIIKQPMGNVKFSVYYALQNATQYPISSLYGTLYESEEKVASVNASMNRGIVVTNQGGIAVTSSGNSIINTGNADNTPIIQASTTSATGGDTADASNDGVWSLSVAIAGVLHQFLKTQKAGSLLLLGNSADTVELLGLLLLDKGITVNGNATFNNAMQVNSTLGVTGNATFGTVSVGGGFQMTGGDITMNGHNFLDATHFNSTISVGGGFAMNGGDVNMNSHGVLGGSYDSLTWKASGDTISQTHEFNGSGAGTYNHGGHSTPWMVSPVSNLNGSTSTVGAASFTTTQCVINMGSAIAFRAGVFVG